MQKEICIEFSTTLESNLLQSKSDWNREIGLLDYRNYQPKIESRLFQIEAMTLQPFQQIPTRPQFANSFVDPIFIREASLITAATHIALSFCERVLRTLRFYLAAPLNVNGTWFRHFLRSLREGNSRKWGKFRFNKWLRDWRGTKGKYVSEAVCKNVLLEIAEKREVPLDVPACFLLVSLPLTVAVEIEQVSGDGIFFEFGRPSR